MAVEGTYDYKYRNASQPLMDGDIETKLRPRQYDAGQLVSHQTAQHVLRMRSPQLEALRQAGGEVDDSRIEEGRPDLQRMSHADAVHLVEDVVGQVVALIEVQIALKTAPVAHSSEHRR